MHKIIKMAGVLFLYTFSDKNLKKKPIIMTTPQHLYFSVFVVIQFKCLYQENDIPYSFKFHPLLHFNFSYCPQDIILQCEFIAMRSCRWQPLLKCTVEWNRNGIRNFYIGFVALIKESRRIRNVHYLSKYHRQQRSLIRKFKESKPFKEKKEKASCSKWWLFFMVGIFSFALIF